MASEQPSVSVIVETYNFMEGSSIDRLRDALGAVERMIGRRDNFEMLLADSSGDPAVGAMIREAFPHVRHVDIPGLDYDEAKLEAARRATGDYVVFLDGDCRPEADNWLDLHVDALRAGARATGGYTRYDGESFLCALESIFDIGFLLPRRTRLLNSYVSNNAGFERSFLLQHPTPVGPLRCRSALHARLLKDLGTPVLMVPGARVRHERRPFFESRYYDGYESVASFWADPSTPGARLLRTGPLFAVLLYCWKVLQDAVRVTRYGRDIDLSPVQRVVALPCVAALRLIDFAGMVRATTRRNRPRAGSPYRIEDDLGRFRRERVRLAASSA